MPYAVSIAVSRDDEPPFFLELNRATMEGEQDMMIIPHLEYGLTLVWRLKLHPGRNRINFQAINASGVEGPPAIFQLDLQQ